MAPIYRPPRPRSRGHDGAAGAIVAGIFAAAALFWILTHWNRGTGSMTLVAWHGPNLGPALVELVRGLLILVALALILALALRLLAVWWALGRRERQIVLPSPEFDPRPADVEAVARQLARARVSWLIGRAGGAYHVHLEARAGEDGESNLHMRMEAPAHLATELRAALNAYSNVSTEEA